MDSTLNFWKSFVAGGALNGLPRSVIRESWMRSKSAAVEPQPAAFTCRRVDPADLQLRLSANAELIAAARPHLNWVTAALRATPHAVCLTDADGVVLEALGDGTRAPGEDWSERAAGTNGAGLALAVGQPVAVIGAEHFAAPLHDRASAAAPIHVDGSIVGTIDIVTRADDGQSERVLLAGHVAHAVGRDLAARSRRSTPELGLITDLAPVLIASCDRQRRFKFVNRGYAERFGLRPEDFTGRPIAEMLGQEAYDAFKEHVELVLAGQTVEFEVEVPYERGPRYMHCAYVPERDAAGEVTGWLSVLTDITEWRRADDRLRHAHRDLEQRVGERTAELVEATEFLQALLESIDDGIVACNSVGELTLLNDTGRRLLGLAPDQFPTDRWAQHGLYHADGVTPLARDEAPLYRALRGERVQNVEIMIVPDRGPARTVLASGQAFRDAEGGLLGAVVSMHDITARKQAEEALRNAHEGLERRVRERTAELAAANDALRQADRLKDEFLAMLAHELRNPLAPIRNALHIMNQPGADRDMVKRVRVMAERQVAHMARLLEDLLDMARIRQGRIELRREAVEVAELIQRTADAMRSLAQDRRHELTVNVPPRALHVHGDPTRLEQVLTNLLHNACKYTDPGGRIWLSAELDSAGAEVVIRVRDNGIGIAPEMLARVFDMFVQVSRRLDRSQGGVGIGLTLVKRLVELHDGTIAARSGGVGQGSEFIVRLPVLAELPAAPSRKKAESWHTIGLPDHRVLIVDDNEDAAESLAMLLKLAGQHVCTAYDGASGLAAAADFGPDLAFIDIGMPGMDGHEVARQLRGKFSPEQLVLVALTGWGQDEDRRRSREAGFDHHLVKPIEPNALKKLLTGAEV